MVVALFSQEINESTKNVINSFFSSRHAEQCKFFIEKNIFDGLEKTDNLNFFKNNYVVLLLIILELCLQFI